MEEAWRSVGVIKNRRGEPHVLQQRMEIYTGEGSSIQGESEEYTRPTTDHRMVPLAALTE